MPRYKCPRCANSIEAASPQGLTCPKCGFGAKGGAPAKPMTAGGMARPAMQQAMPAGGLRGKPRSFAFVFFIGLLTLGIYWLVYFFLVFKEVDTQNGWDHATAKFILGIVIPFIGFIFMILYMVAEFRNLQRARQARGLQPGFGAGGFYAWSILGILLLGLGPIIAMYKLNKSAREYWIAMGARA